MISSISNSTSAFENELHVSPRPVAVILAILGFIIAFTSTYRFGFQQQSTILLLGLLIQTMSWVIWQLDASKRLVSRWLTIILLVSMIFIADSWLDTPGLLTLLVIPTILAAGLMGLRTAILTAIVETMFLVFLTKYAIPDTSSTSIVVALIAIWTALGMLVAVYQPMYRVTVWSWKHCQQAQSLLEETRDRKAELEQALDELMHANRQLDLLNEKLVVMRRVAEEAQRAKVAFVAKVSHEFRTPLNMIIGLADLLLETPEVYGQKLPLSLQDDLEIVYRNCEHLSSMINDVLDLSQVETGRLSLHREWVNLGEDIESAVVVVRPLVEKKQLSLQVDVPADLPEIYCDQTRIRQVILNLVSNAVRYTEKGSITVRVDPQGQDVVVSIADTGPGISPNHTERIFEPFYQSMDNPWLDQGGSGLGLSISKQLIELHGGRIWLESNFGTGSTFSFQLPISPPEKPVSTPKRWLSEDWVWTERTSKPKIPRLPFKQRMVICDEVGDLYHALANYSDEIEFVDTRNISQVIEELQKCPAHAVMVNTESPHDLWPLVQSAKQEIPDTPILACSFSPRVEHALRAGSVDYLVKPITRIKLVKAVAKVGQPVKRVLVVDDNPDVQQLLARMLVSYDDTLEVTSALNAQHALEELRNSPPDLMLLDLMMPDLDGWQLLDLKNQDETIRDIPVIIISAQDPAGQAMTSQVLLATIGQGLSVDKLLDCSLTFSKLLLGTAQEPGPAPERIVGVESVLAQKA